MNREHDIAQNTSSTPSAPESQRNLYVAGMPEDVTDQEAHRMFSRFGQIEALKCMFDHETGKAKGYGFVLYATAKSAAEAIRQCHKTVLRGKTLTVRLGHASATPRLDGSASEMNMSGSGHTSSNVAPTFGHLSGRRLSGSGGGLFGREAVSPMNQEPPMQQGAFVPVFLQPGPYPMAPQYLPIHPTLVSYPQQPQAPGGFGQQPMVFLQNPAQGFYPMPGGMQPILLLPQPAAPPGAALDSSAYPPGSGGPTVYAYPSGSYPIG